MTEQRSATACTETRAGVYSSVFSLSAIFIAFAILATALCASIPVFRIFISLPVNESLLTYDYTGLSDLISDSLTFSAKRIGLAFCLLICAFSLYGNAVISAITAFNGFCCGCVVFYSLLRFSDIENIGKYLLFYVFCKILTVFYASASASAHKALFSAPQTQTLHIAARLVFVFLSFSGALCLLKLIELALL